MLRLSMAAFTIFGRAAQRGQTAFQQKPNAASVLTSSGGGSVGVSKKRREAQYSPRLLAGKEVFCVV